MHSKRVRRYYCDYCQRGFWKGAQARHHEPHCFKREDREPYFGELSSLRDTGVLVNFGEEPFGGNGPGGLDWVEWVPHDPPPWWPGPGKIWTGLKWEDVPGYKYEYPTGAHGCAGGPAPEEFWPLVARPYADPEDAVVRLDEVPARCRPDLLSQIRERHGCPIGLHFPSPGTALVQLTDPGPF